MLIVLLCNQGKKMEIAGEAEVCQWVEAVVGKKCVSIEEDFRSGVYLCELINAIVPNTIKKINKFRQVTQHNNAHPCLLRRAWFLARRFSTQRSFLVSLLGFHDDGKH